MVYLSRIYTRTGDHGETGLGDGTRVAKDHPRVAAYGKVDELNAVLGLLILEAGEERACCGASRTTCSTSAPTCACRPTRTSRRARSCAVRPEQATGLEHEIDRLNARLQPLQSFVLPGGSKAAAWCHLARTVCRRAERAVVTLARAEAVNPQVVIYLNRLSDLLFVLARVANNDGQADVLWVPGGKPP